MIKQKDTSKECIVHFEESDKSENVILDLSRAKLSDRQGISRTKEFIRKEHSRIKHLKLLTKDGHIIDIK